MPPATQSDSLPQASVVIATRNRPQYIRDAVDSILAGAVLPGELIVVDQSDAPDGHLRALSHERIEIRYIHRSEVGLSRSTNQGIALARHDVVALTDDDILVDANTVRGLDSAGVRGAFEAVGTSRFVKLAASDKRALVEVLGFWLDEVGVDELPNGPSRWGTPSKATPTRTSGERAVTLTRRGGPGLTTLRRWDDRANRG